MFIKISNINYYINSNNKSVEEIYYELIPRLNNKKISNKEKQTILEIIQENLNHEMLSSNSYRSF